MDTLAVLAALLAVGIGAQWIAWRVRVPAIILLLGCGFVFGKDRLDLGLHALFSDELLFPIVSASVALILFEGGLSLRLADLRKHGRTVMRLITVGAVVTWILSTLAAHWIVGLPWNISVLLGAILIVSGPTVVLPLLRHIGPRGKTGPILTWEGIAIDPVGAVLAVLVYEGFALGGSAATGHWIMGLAKTVIIGGGLGALGGWALVQMLRRYWVPDQLQIPVTLALVVGAFALSNYAQHESGLLTVTVMGVWAANSGVSVRHILEFKEHLRVLLISCLFLLLASRLGNTELRSFDASWLIFLGVLLVVVRPISVWISTRGSDLTREEKLFLAWMCPRGIVAAAVASVFGLELAAAGVKGAETLVPLTFLVIVGTVVIYGFTAGPLARRLGLAVPNPQGLLLVGAHAWARTIAAILQKEGVTVALVDLNRANVLAARLAGLKAHNANVLDGHEVEELELFGIGRVLALTPNDEVNKLVVLHLAHTFGRSNTFRLPRDTVPSKEKPADAGPQHGRQLFAPTADFFELSARFGRGGLRVTTLSETFDFAAFLAEHGERALPLFVLEPSGTLTIATPEIPLAPGPGARVVALVDKEPA
ncbi:MAG: cation:proton antiporter [Planctomycetota bacterium]|nr:cation:proton antiporter [Planctomycetota bacterium]